MLLELNIGLVISIVCVAVVVVVLLILCFFFLFKKKKNPKIRVDEEFIHKLLTALGSKKNILDVKNINGRVIFEVEDLELVTFDTLKSLSTAGVFITNQSIKMLFNFDSDVICKTILANIKEK